MRVLERSVMVAADCCRLDAIVLLQARLRGLAGWLAGWLAGGGVGWGERGYRQIIAREGIWGRVSQGMSIAGDPGERGSEWRLWGSSGREGVGRNFPKSRQTQWAQQKLETNKRREHTSEGACAVRGLWLYRRRRCCRRLSRRAHLLLNAVPKSASLGE